MRKRNTHRFATRLHRKLSVNCGKQPECFGLSTSSVDGNYATNQSQTMFPQTLAKRHLLACMVMVYAAVSRADVSSSVAALKELGINVTTPALAALGLGAVLIAFYLFALIIRKIQKGKRPDMMSGVPYLDVTGMGKQGLLTPEEMSRVRASMSRQVAKRNTHTLPSGLPVELALMADPDVQRLEALASEKAKEPRTTIDEAKPQPPQPASDVVETVLFPQKQDFPDTIDPLNLPGSNSVEEMQLPADVIKMAELGLISSDELERIKQRIRDKRNQL